MSNQPTISIQAKKTAVLLGHSSKVQLLCKVLGADTPTELPERNPLHLALVLDKSGSMSGQPLEESKKCAINIVNRLNEHDKVTIVSYDDHITVNVPLVSVTEKKSIIQKIESIESGGMTDLFGGWKTGVDQLEQAVTDDSLSRVLLLSDGCANSGLTESAAIVRECNIATDKGVTTSTYGLGHNFNEDLMVSMGNSGGGSSYYGETAEELDEPFSTEFDLLSSLCAKNISLNFDSPYGVKVLNTQLVHGDKGWKVNNLPYEGAVWMAVELNVPAEATSVDGDMDLGTLTVTYTDMDGQEHTIEQSFVLPTLPASAYADLVDNAEIVQRINELKASELQLKAKQAVLERNWDAVDELVKQVVALGQESGNAWIAEIAEEMKKLATIRDRRLFAKEALYSSSRFQKRHIQRRYHASLDCSIDLDEPSFLSRKARQGKRKGK